MVDQLLEAHDVWSFLDSTEALLLPGLIAVSHCGGGSHGWFCHHDRSRWVSQWHRVTWHKKRGIRMLVQCASCRLFPTMNVSGRDLKMRPWIGVMMQVSFFERQRHHKERSSCPAPRTAPRFTRPQDGRWISFVISRWIDLDYDGYEVFICWQHLGGSGEILAS